MKIFNYIVLYSQTQPHGPNDVSLMSPTSCQDNGGGIKGQPISQKFSAVTKLLRSKIQSFVILMSKLKSNDDSNGSQNLWTPLKRKSF